MTFNKYLVACLILSISLASCSHQTFRVLEKPIVFNEERKKLSLDYMEERHGIKTSEPTIQPRMVVLHWTAIPTLEQSYDAFYAPTLKQPQPFLFLQLLRATWSGAGQEPF